MSVASYSSVPSCEGRSVLSNLRRRLFVEKYRVPPGLSIPRHFATSEIQSLFMSRVVSVLLELLNVGGSRIIMS